MQPLDRTAFALTFGANLGLSEVVQGKMIENEETAMFGRSNLLPKDSEIHQAFYLGQLFTVPHE